MTSESEKTMKLVTNLDRKAIEGKLAEVTAAGGTLKAAPKDVGGGRLVATFTDSDGNVLGLIQDR